MLYQMRMTLTTSSYRLTEIHLPLSLVLRTHTLRSGRLLPELR